jgi:hypothetical protein
VVGVIYIRTVGHDPALWHVDPVVAERSGRPNDAVAAPPACAPTPRSKRRSCR